MSFNYKSGNLLESDCDYICQQVNCQGRMASGIAKQIRTKWPIVYTSYAKKCSDTSPELILGDIQVVNLPTNQYMINMFSQLGYGYDGMRYTSYDAFWNCLNLIKEIVPKGRKIGFPYRIGCGLGGANWPVIETMIEQVLNKDYDVWIYCLEE